MGGDLCHLLGSVSEVIPVPLAHHGHHAGHHKQCHLLLMAPVTLGKEQHGEHFFLGCKQNGPLHQQTAEFIALQGIEQLFLLPPEGKKTLQRAVGCLKALGKKVDGKIHQRMVDEGAQCPLPAAEISAKGLPGDVQRKAQVGDGDVLKPADSHHLQKPLLQLPLPFGRLLGDASLIHLFAPFFLYLSKS